MIDAGLVVRHKNPKVKGSGVTDGRHSVMSGDTYIFTTWDDGEGEPYTVWMDIRGLIIRVKAKTRRLSYATTHKFPILAPFGIFDALSDHYKWSSAGDTRSRHR